MNASGRTGVSFDGIFPTCKGRLLVHKCKTNERTRKPLENREIMVTIGLKHAIDQSVFHLNVNKTKLCLLASRRISGSRESIARRLNTSTL